MNALLIAVGLCTLLTASEGLRCYVCSNCGSLDPGSTNTTNCTDNCGKFLISGQTSRNCADGACTLQGALNTTATVCCKDKDLCNGEAAGNTTTIVPNTTAATADTTATTAPKTTPKANHGSTLYPAIPLSLLILLPIFGM